MNPSAIFLVLRSSLKFENFLFLSKLELKHKQYLIDDYNNVNDNFQLMYVSDIQTKTIAFNVSSNSQNSSFEYSILYLTFMEKYSMQAPH
jgi:uncharacterized pyridoxamine 5'-phosphate oxidase family protein